MMTCRELVELLIDYVADQLPIEERERIELHLRGCLSCVAYADSYRFTVQLPQQLPRAPLPLELQQRLQTILEDHCKEQSTRQAAGNDKDTARLGADE